MQELCSENGIYDQAQAIRFFKQIISSFGGSAGRLSMVIDLTSNSLIWYIMNKHKYIKNLVSILNVLPKFSQYYLETHGATSCVTFESTYELSYYHNKATFGYYRITESREMGAYYDFTVYAVQTTMSNTIDHSMSTSISIFKDSNTHGLSLSGINVWQLFYNAKYSITNTLLSYRVFICSKFW